jgi:hypothetical protein
MKPAEPDRVKLFVGILYSDEKLLDRAVDILQKKYGELDYISEPFSFDITDYYEPEMGSPIVRKFVSFERLVHPKELARIKIETNSIEDLLAVKHNRKVNLDPGIMDYDKVVLASAKYNGQKIYLDHGIWADLTLHFEKNRFDPYPWSFPDFKKGIYNDGFLKIRQKYKGQRRKG